MCLRVHQYYNTATPAAAAAAVIKWVERSQTKWGRAMTGRLCETCALTRKTKNMQLQLHSRAGRTSSSRSCLHYICIIITHITNHLLCRRSVFFFFASTCFFFLEKQPSKNMTDEQMGDVDFILFYLEEPATCWRLQKNFLLPTLVQRCYH